MTLQVESPTVYTCQGVPISVTGIAQVRLKKRIFRNFIYLILCICIYIYMCTYVYMCVYISN
jgi:hypothetical protein